MYTLGQTLKSSLLGASLVSLVWALACGSGTTKPDGTGGTGAAGGTGGMAGTAGAGGAYLQSLLPENYTPEDFRRALLLPASSPFKVTSVFSWKASVGRPFPVDLNVLEGSEQDGRALVQVFADGGAPHARVGLAIVKLEPEVPYVLELELGASRTEGDAHVEVVLRRQADGRVVLRGREALEARPNQDVELTFATPITTTPCIKLEPVLIDSSGAP